MNLSDLSLSQLEHIIGLVQEKESLQAKLDKVIADLRRLERGESTTTKNETATSIPRSPKRRSKRRGGMRAAVLKALTVAGAKGVGVKQLAAVAKVNPASLNTWLYTTGKKISGLKKISPGIFAYQS